MNYPDNLYSIRSETVCLGGLIKYPKFLIEVDKFLSEKDFVHKVHRVIFSILRNMVLSGQEANPVIISQKCKELGLSMFEELNIFDYLDSACFTNINEDGIKELSKELIKLRIKRELWDNAAAIQSYIRETSEKNIDELINGVDGIYNRQISLYSLDNRPKDLYEDIESIIKTIAKNPVEESGLITPFPIFNKWFSGLLSSNGIYVTTGLSGNGKSCFMFNMGKGVAKLNNCKVLILDTEMSIDMNQFRAASAEMQVNQFYLRTGQWTRNKELSEKVLNGFDKLNKYKGMIYHMYIPNKNIQEVLSIAKRWYYSEVNRGNKALIIYDYLKISSDLDKNRNEWQQLGDKVSYLNELGNTLNIPIYSGAQQNRTALEQGGGRRDDSSTVGGSDRINQYACFNSIFREKTPEEISEHGLKFGSHILIPIKTSRTQGIDSYDTNKNVQVIGNDGKKKYKRNFLNYQINSYDINEIGSYKDIVINQSLNKPLENGKKEMIEI